MDIIKRRIQKHNVITCNVTINNKNNWGESRLVNLRQGFFVQNKQCM